MAHLATAHRPRHCEPRKEEGSAPTAAVPVRSEGSARWSLEGWRRAAHSCGKRTSCKLLAVASSSSLRSQRSHANECAISQRCLFEFRSLFCMIKISLSPEDISWIQSQDFRMPFPTIAPLRIDNGVCPIRNKFQKLAHWTASEIKTRKRRVIPEFGDDGGCSHM
jgi:hypothetical protein